MDKEKKYISASRIKTLDSCSWLYWGKYHLGLPDKSNEGALRGTICHLVFECLLKKRHKKHYDLIVNSRSISGSPPIYKIVKRFLKKNNIDNEENNELVNDMILVGLNQDFFGEKGVQIGEPEQEFKIENDTPKYYIYGFIDKILKYKKGSTIKIVDYKSSKAKFKGEELESNTQALLYSVVAKKMWPEFKRVLVQFVFLRFPKSPIQELEFSEDAMSGFEKYLEHVNNIITNFEEKDSRSNLAVGGKNKWLCGVNKWVCPLKHPFDYYVLSDKDGKKIKSSFENDLVAAENQTVEKRKYDGCPAFYSKDGTGHGVSASASSKEKDPFDF